MANAYQSALLEFYPTVDMLPIDRNDPEDIDRRVAQDGIGDSMFQFLWNELGVADSTPSAEMVLDMAIQDIEEVMEAFRRQPGRTDLRRILVESYTKETKFGFDLNDEEAVQSAVDENRTNDLLFTFLWRDLDGVDDPEAAVEGLEAAITEIGTVRNGILSSLVPEGPSH